MPKIKGEDGRFHFYWDGTKKADIKDIIDELTKQYADHVWNMFGVEEPEAIAAKHNLEWLVEVMKELK